jgi:hypothetical protein
LRTLRSPHGLILRGATPPVVSSDAGVPAVVYCTGSRDGN